MKTLVRRAVVVSSLLLVAACIIGALYLNQSHREVSWVLTENVASTVADKELETTLDELPPLLRGDHSRLELLTAELIRRHEKARQQLKNVADYADTDEEKELVNEVKESWERYLEAWGKRPRASSPEELRKFDRGLALQLEEGVLLHCSHLLEYNTRQVSASNDADRRVVDQLTWGLMAVGIAAPMAG